MNDFKTDLQYSLQSNDDEEINKLYRVIFPNLKDIVPVTDIQQQRLGIDKKLIFDNGKVILIDEKKRREDYGDILLEEYSDFDRKIKGWLDGNKNIDYITYIIFKEKKLYLLPYELLYKAFLKNYDNWLKKYGRKFAPNQTYKTSFIAVQPEELLNAIKAEMFFQVDKETISKSPSDNPFFPPGEYKRLFGNEFTKEFFTHLQALNPATTCFMSRKYLKKNFEQLEENEKYHLTVCGELKGNE